VAGSRRCRCRRGGAWLLVGSSWLKTAARRREDGGGARRLFAVVAGAGTVIASGSLRRRFVVVVRELLQVLTVVGGRAAAAAGWRWFAQISAKCRDGAGVLAVARGGCRTGGELRSGPARLAAAAAVEGGRRGEN